jgi:hypothetical protein
MVQNALKSDFVGIERTGFHFEDFGNFLNIEATNIIIDADFGGFDVRMSGIRRAFENKKLRVGFDILLCNQVQFR